MKIVLEGKRFTENIEFIVKYFNVNLFRNLCVYVIVNFLIIVLFLVVVKDIYFRDLRFLGVFFLCGKEKF